MHQCITQKIEEDSDNDFLVVTTGSIPEQSDEFASKIYKTCRNRAYLRTTSKAYQFVFDYHTQ